ncbi:hypothetical protein OE88DRAFT_1650547 [Heliocybe sulcata]|uniref:Uncharacterized protein n=1 Tax=Heliocybe sulcata TaxID=5364 RepID=A0A5C3NI06_9AGAM|nr:hypothetical protein OE88DRAFT_1650547 [Heliocybe sulcata]
MAPIVECRLSLSSSASHPLYLKLSTTTNDGSKRTPKRTFSSGLIGEEGRICRYPSVPETNWKQRGSHTYHPNRDLITSPKPIKKADYAGPATMNSSTPPLAGGKTRATGKVSWQMTITVPSRTGRVRRGSLARRRYHLAPRLGRMKRTIMRRGNTATLSGGRCIST